MGFCTHRLIRAFCIKQGRNANILLFSGNVFQVALVSLRITHSPSHFPPAMEEAASVYQHKMSEGGGGERGGATLSTYQWDDLQRLGGIALMILKIEEVVIREAKIPLLPRIRPTRALFVQETSDIVEEI